MPKTSSSNNDLIKSKLIKNLEDISSMTKEEAKNLLLSQVRQELTSEVAKKVKEAEERIKTDSKKLAQEIILDAMRHGATEYTAEYTVSSITVPNEEVKGRIIGAGGRNIRTFEKETGVELELDETAAIRLSSFDSV